MHDVLLVEDDQAVAQPLSVALAREGYSVQVQGTASGALDALAARGFDLVVLDVQLPDGDGLHVCREIRQRGMTELPILLLTARAEEIDIVVGLDSGANDYVTKPFRLAELLARMRALTRRAVTTQTLSAGSVMVDVDARRAWLDDVPLDLAPKEFDLLVLLVRERGSVVSRARLAAEVWEGEIAATGRTIDTHVSALRRKLAGGGRQVSLTTLRGTGFRLEVE